MATGQYVLYGTTAKEHDIDNSDVNAKSQRAQNLEVVHDTDDKNEALKLYNAGGFERNGVWVAIVGGKDTETGVTVGIAPEDDY